MQSHSMKTSEKIIHLIKENGALTARTLASELGLTTMGVRQHMLRLEDVGEVVFEDRKAVRGRPTRTWRLTPATNQRFPNGHESLAFQLIDSVKEVFGEQGLEQLITKREQETLLLYRQTLDPIDNLQDKLNALADLRTKEGYMSSVELQNGFFRLIENHCAICAAATHCVNFCHSELRLFRTLLSDLCFVSREEHIFNGAHRCVYKIIPHSPTED